jgi:hypothetical protein
VKQIDFQQAKAKYSRFDSLYNQAEEHDSTPIIADSTSYPHLFSKIYGSSCRKVAYESDRGCLNIAVDEWPLLEERNYTWVVVLELQVADWLTHPRYARQYLLMDILRGFREQIRTLAICLLAPDVDGLQGRQKSGTLAACPKSSLSTLRITTKRPPHYLTAFDFLSTMTCGNVSYDTPRATWAGELDFL